jgi:hypothetical protein
MGCGCHSKLAEQPDAGKPKAAESAKPDHEPAKSVRRDGTHKRPGLGAVAPHNDGASSDARCEYSLYTLSLHRRGCPSLDGQQSVSKHEGWNHQSQGVIEYRLQFVFGSLLEGK